MRIQKIDGLMAVCEAKGQVREVRLLYLLDEALAPGDFLVVERGNALQKISPEDAAAAWAIYDEMLTLADGGPAAKGPVTKHP